MSKSITQNKAAIAEKFIKQVLEPKIKELIEIANESLNTKDIQIGASIEWYIDKKEKEE